jgi:23S rRNA pseudouridine1911/1915/1917 synthase
MQVVYEDNHIIIVSKRSGEIVQGDKTGDEPLSETVKKYIKDKYHKPGNVFLGVVHRLDRPVAGLVVFAKTSKALSRLNNMFRDGDGLNVESEATLTHWIVRNEKAILAPSEANFIATALPMPRAAPVIRAVLPVNNPIL